MSIWFAFVVLVCCLGGCFDFSFGLCGDWIGLLVFDFCALG